jgi:hypothetical protein
MRIYGETIIKKSRIALFAVLAILTALSGPSRAGTIGIDFGCSTATPPHPDCIEGVDPLQTGYAGWVEPYTGSPGFDYNETRSFSGDFAVGGTFDLNITSDGLFFRDYGFTSDVNSPFASSANLLADDINRNQPGSIAFTFGGLAPGSYTMESFHHDSEFGTTTVPFDIIVMDALGTRTVASGLDTSGGFDPTAITTALYAFTVGASGAATIIFDTDNAGNTEHMSVNGFQLTGAAAVPIPAATWLFGSGLLGLIGIAKRSRQS